MPSDTLVDDGVPDEMPPRSRAAERRPAREGKEDASEIGGPVPHMRCDDIFGSQCDQERRTCWSGRRFRFRWRLLLRTTPFWLRCDLADFLSRQRRKIIRVAFQPNLDNCTMHGRGDILPPFERVTHVVVALGSAAGSFCSFCTGQFGVFVSVDIRCCNDGMLAGRLTECRITFSIAPPGRVWTGDLVAATLLAMVCPPLRITCGRLSDVCCGKLGKCAFLR